MQTSANRQQQSINYKDQQKKTQKKKTPKKQEAQNKNQGLMRQEGHRGPVWWDRVYTDEWRRETQEVFQNKTPPD